MCRGGEDWRGDNVLEAGNFAFMEQFLDAHSRLTVKSAENLPVEDYKKLEKMSMDFAYDSFVELKEKQLQKNQESYNKYMYALQRSTLYHSSDKLIATLKALDVLESEKVGVYSIKKHPLSSAEIINFMLFTMMKIDDAGYYSIREMDNLLYLFPFEYKVSKEAILGDERFTTGTFGGEMSFSLKE